MNRFFVALLVLALSVTAATQVKAQALTISTPGVYVLNRNITVASGDAIVITASNVTLDMGGRTVSTTGIATGRGVVVTSAKSVVIKNGRINSFNFGVFASNSEALTIEGLTITGDNLGGGPVQQGIVFLNTRGSRIEKNTLTSLNLGILVRGGGTVGNRWFDNTIVGGAVRANNLLAMCWNPPMGGNGADPAQVSSGELVYNNHITGFLDGISFTSGGRGNIIRENNIQFYTRAFRPDTLLAGVATLDGNIEVLLP